MEAADLFALVSVHEGLPHVILECFDAGLAVLATAVGGVPEIVTNGKNGWLIPPNDEAALRNAIDQLASDPALRRRLADGGRKSLIGRFTQDAMVKDTERVLRETAGVQSA
jgi:glycosyltransferase involved in cell wall biosynthesis